MVLCPCCLKPVTQTSYLRMLARLDMLNALPGLDYRDRLEREIIGDLALRCERAQASVDAAHG